MRRNDSSPEAYRKDVLGEQSEMLETIREAIFEVAPDMEEIIEYGMLGYPGLANLAAQKHYVALYVPPAVLAEHRDRFPGTDCGSRSGPQHYVNSLSGSKSTSSFIT